MIPLPKKLSSLFKSNHYSATPNTTVLIVEGSSHYKILEQIYHLLNARCALFFYIIKPRFDYAEMFPSSTKSSVRTARFRGILLFFSVLMRAWKYDILYISTGPESNHYTAPIQVLGFYFCCLLYGPKIILTIRNIPPYLKTTPTFSSWLLSRAIRRVRRFTFETATMKKQFRKLTEHPRAYYAVSYDRYPNVLAVDSNVLSTVRKRGNIRVGLLGSVSEERRDYRVVFDALSKVPQDVRKQIEFVVMGDCPLGIRNQIIKKFEYFASVDCKFRLLSEAEFSSLGLSCDVLLAPLSDKHGYGVLKGTGSIGDAVYLKRRLIIPGFVDPEREFEDFCMYYNGARELANLFSSILGHLDLRVSDALFAKFETDRVYQCLISELHLPCSVESTVPMQNM